MSPNDPDSRSKTDGHDHDEVFDPDEFLGESWRVFGNIGHPDDAPPTYFAEIRKNPRPDPTHPYALYSKKGADGTPVFRQRLRYVPRTRTLEGTSGGVMRCISLWDQDGDGRPDRIFAVRSTYLGIGAVEDGALCEWEKGDEDPATWGGEDG